jgi:hypothetical protein
LIQNYSCYFRSPSSNKQHYNCISGKGPKRNASQFETPPRFDRNQKLPERPDTYGSENLPIEEKKPSTGLQVQISAQMKNNLADLIENYPEGMPLIKLQRFYEVTFGSFCVAFIFLHLNLRF